jgi:oxygen-independent coproporphyrinogen-3 oxidase
MNGHASARGAVIKVVPTAAIAGPHFRALPPLSLYVHIPWCLKKCPYCDFNSHAIPGDSRDGVPEEAYVDALIADLETALPAVWGRRVESIFVGGGTPSLFSPAAIDRLLAAVRARLPVAPGAEVTLEANPGTFERERFAGYYAAGVNRLSLGVQSFDDANLVALGRVHGAAEASRAAEAAMMIFGNVNLDLMFALPGQMPEGALRDVRAALSFAPPHLSFYHLTIEPNTLFHHRPPPLPDDDIAADIEEAIVETLSDAGYRHYETSAHAKPGYACQHNLNYWRFGDYLGIGAGAHSKLSFPDEVRRQLRWKQPRRYLEQISAGTPLQEDVAVERSALPFEFMLNALRLADGVPAALFAERTGLSLGRVAQTIGAAVDRGLMEPGTGLLKPTPLGRRFLNDLQQMFLS